MKKEFIKDLTELINKHSLESEMNDTPDYILAQVAIDAMVSFSDAVSRRDEFYGWKADKQNKDNKETQDQEDCSVCNERFKCLLFLEKQPINVLIKRQKETKDIDEKKAITKILREIRQNEHEQNENEQNGEEMPAHVKTIAAILESMFGCPVEIHRYIKR